METSGIKKNTDPYVAAELLVILLRDVGPVISLENFEPETSFSGSLMFLFYLS